MKIALLTGGGDAPGLNSVIRAVVKSSSFSGIQVVGVRRGWAGLVDLDYFPLEWKDVENISSKGGTILKSSRTNPTKLDNGIVRVSANLARIADGLIAMGGEDTLGVALAMFKGGVNVVGVPKTIDNDLSGTDFTIGFDTSLNTTVEVIDRVRTTGESHERFMVIEVMGRQAGWLAVHSGLASGADLILLPEEPFDLDMISAHLQKLRMEGRKSGIIVVAEGAHPKESSKAAAEQGEVDAFGHARLGGVGEALSQEITKRTGLETRHVVIGHIARGGVPSAFDRVFGTRLGVEVVNLVKEKKWGQMLSLRGTRIVSMDLEEGVSKLKTVGPDYIQIRNMMTTI